MAQEDDACHRRIQARTGQGGVHCRHTGSSRCLPGRPCSRVARRCEGDASWTKPCPPLSSPLAIASTTLASTFASPLPHAAVSNHDGLIHRACGAASVFRCDDCCARRHRTGCTTARTPLRTTRLRPVFLAPACAPPMAAAAPSSTLLHSLHSRSAQRVDILALLPLAAALWPAAGPATFRLYLSHPPSCLLHRLSIARTASATRQHRPHVSHPPRSAAGAAERSLLTHSRSPPDTLLSSPFPRPSLLLATPLRTSSRRSLSAWWS